MAARYSSEVESFLLSVVGIYASLFSALASLALFIYKHLKDYFEAFSVPGSRFVSVLNARRRSSAAGIRRPAEDLKHVMILEATSRIGKYLAFAYAEEGTLKVPFDLLVDLVLKLSFAFLFLII